MNKSLLFLFIIPFIALTSCTRYYYKPNGVNTPLFTDGGQAHIGLAGSTGDGDGAGTTNFFDVQASVSPIRHLGIIGNYSTYAFNPDAPDPASGNVQARAQLIEGGVGGYYALGNRKVKMVVDLYGGGGTGSIRSDVDMDVTRLFLQPGIGMHSPWVDAAFNMRFSRIMYRNLDDNGRGNNYLISHQLMDIYNNNRRIDQGGYSFFEPTFTVRAGYKFAKAQFQMVISHPVNYVPWHYNGARFTAGFYLSIEDIIELARTGKAAD